MVRKRIRPLEVVGGGGSELATNSQEEDTSRAVQITRVKVLGVEGHTAKCSGPMVGDMT